MSKTYKEKGFDESMLKIAIIRSPFNWLKSIYFHRYYRKFIYLKYIDHKGWGNIVKDLRATDFEDFIIKYCNKSYRNKYTFVYDGVLKQLTDPIRNILDVDIIVYNEYLNDFIRELSSIKGISDKIDIKNLNKGNTKDVHISSYAESLLLRNFRSYMEFTGYNLYKLNVDKKRYIRVY